MLECVIIDDDSVGLYHLVTVYRLTSAVACGNGRGCKKKRKKTLVKKKLEHLKIGCAVPKKGAGRKRQRSAEKTCRAIRGHRCVHASEAPCTPPHAGRNTWRVQYEDKHHLGRVCMNDRATVVYISSDVTNSVTSYTVSYTHLTLPTKRIV